MWIIGPNLFQRCGYFFCWGAEIELKEHDTNHVERSDYDTSPRMTNVFSNMFMVARLSCHAVSQNGLCEMCGR